MSVRIFFPLITVQRGHLSSFSSFSLSLPLSFANKRRGTAPIEPGKRGAAGGGGGGGGKIAEQRNGRRKGWEGEGWVQVPLASRSEVLQAGRQLTSTSLRSSRTMTQHHKTRCVPGNRLTSTPLLAKLHKAQNVSFLHLLIWHTWDVQKSLSDGEVICAPSCSWIPAAGFLLIQWIWHLGWFLCFSIQAQWSCMSVLLQNTSELQRVLRLSTFLQESVPREWKNGKEPKGAGY